MRVLLDECLPFDLVPLLVGHEVQPVARMGWAGVKNGALLVLAAQHFECLLTIDRRLALQHAVPETLMVVTVRARSNRVQDLAPLVPALLDALRSLQPGIVVRVGT